MNRHPENTTLSQKELELLDEFGWDWDRFQGFAWVDVAADAGHFSRSNRAAVVGEFKSEGHTFVAQSGDAYRDVENLLAAGRRFEVTAG